jgi:hypothetical protein
MGIGVPARVWADNPGGGTAIDAARLNALEQDVADGLVGAGGVRYLGAPSGDTSGVADTTAIRAALAAVAAAGGGVVRAQPGKLYQVAPTAFTQTVAHPSGSTAARNPCIMIPAGVVLDMAGSTLQLRGATQAWLVCNGNTSGTGTRDHDLGLRNVVLDLRSIVYNDRAGVHFSHIDRLELRNVKIINGSYFATWIYNINDSVFDDLDADGVVGQPWQFGDPQAGGDGFNQVYRSSFGAVRSRNITLYDTGSHPGNIFTGVLTDCTIDSIFGYNCSAGVKIQAPSKNVVVGLALLDTTGEASALNSGFKYQGDATWGNIKNCSVGQIVAVNQVNMGLALLYTENCSVGTYVGRNNCLLATNGDAFLGSGINDYIGSINSSNSGGAGVRISVSPGLSQIPTGFRLPNVRVTNPGQVSIIKSGFRIDYAGTSGTVGDLVCIDDQATKTMTRGVDVTVSGVVGSIATFTCTGFTDVAFSSSSAGFAVAGAGTLAAIATSGSASDLSTGTVPDARISSAITRDSELVNFATTSYVDAALGTSTGPQGSLLGWTFDPAISTPSAISSGRTYLWKVPVPHTITVTNLITYVSVAGVALIATGCNMALYDSTGARIGATADMSTAMGSIGLKTTALIAPVDVTGGATTFVWIGMKASFTTTSPQFLRSFSAVTVAINSGLTAATARSGVIGANDTATQCPSSFTPSAIDFSSANPLLMYAALS